MIEVRNLSKRYGDTTAVDDISFTVRQGIITGFVGPNGAGKSTTMRCILGLDEPTEGSAVVNGKPYREHAAPLLEVGAMLEARAIHTGRSARNHLLALAQTHGIARGRVDEVIELVGLADVAKKRAGGFSLGMGQRLGIASALLGDPKTLILDEPVNGLDPEGILWIRNLLKNLAAAGRTIFVSSHLMSEMALTAEHLIVIGRGRIIADMSVEAFIDQVSSNEVRVRTPQVAQFSRLLEISGANVVHGEADALAVSGLSSAAIGELAATNAVILHELSPQEPSLEEAFLELTRDAVQYHGHAEAALVGARQRGEG